MQIDLNLNLDTAQRRVKKSRIAALVGAYDELSPNYWVDTYVEKSAGTTLLMPAPLRPAWATNFTGINARLAKTDFVLTSGTWLQRSLNAPTGDWILDLQAANEPVITSASYGANQAWFIKWMVYGNGHDNFTQMWCGMATVTDGGTGVALKLNPTGAVEVWKDDVLVGRYPFCGTTRDQDISGKYVWACIIPGIRRNGLLIITSQGGEFIHYFDDLDETDSSIEVTPATKFWWNVPEGQASVQVAPIKYPDTGYRCSKSIFLGDIPDDLGAATYNVIATLNGGSTSAKFVKRYDPTTDYDGAIVACRMKITLNGAAGKTPFVYASQVEYPALYADTDGSSPTDLLPFTQQCSLTVPESPSGVQLEVAVKNPEAVQAAAELAGVGGDMKLAIIENRPLQALIDGVLVFDGVGGEPEFQDHWNEENKHVKIAFRDPWALLEEFRYRDPKVWDGWYFIDWIIDVLNDAGVVHYVIQADPFQIPDVPPGNGRYNLSAERGETAAQILMRGFEAYAGLWRYFFRPQGGFHRFIAGDDSPGGLFDPAATPVLKLYETLQGAMDALGVDAATARSHVFRDFSERPLPIEANFVKITGADLRNGDPIEVQKSDYASMDPTKLVADRPDNWTGSFRPLGIYNRYVTSLNVGKRACEKKFDQCSKKYFCAEFGMPFMGRIDGGDLLWRGHIVEIENRGIYELIAGPTSDIHRVNDPDLDVSIEQLYSSAPAHYVGIRVGTV